MQSCNQSDLILKKKSGQKSKLALFKKEKETNIFKLEVIREIVPVCYLSSCLYKDFLTVESRDTSSIYYQSQ